jgi:hypothetical protein
MAQFKIGDRVEALELYKPQCNGKWAPVTVLEIDSSPSPYYVKFEDGRQAWRNTDRVRPIKEEPMYEIIKPVSIKALEDAGACERELHRFAFLVLEHFATPMYFSETIHSVVVVIKLAKQCSGGIQFLLDKGFIAKKRPDLAVDAPVLVDNLGGNCWKRRYFKEWGNNGDIICWYSGRTSWNANHNAIIPGAESKSATTWGQWKLPEDK